MYDFVLISCEHAGNMVPYAYRNLFAEDEEVLKTHLGYDIGAIGVARYLSEELDAPLYFYELSRLLVEPNRLLKSKELFSKYSKDLPAQDKIQIIDQFYLPYRDTLNQIIGKNIDSTNKLLHLSIHTFTPIWEGEERKVDIGILFDPERKEESLFAEKLKKAIHEQNMNLRVCFNEPYEGVSDGITTFFRSKYPTENYLGIELELNQKYVLAEDEIIWNQMKTALANAIKRVIAISKTD